jgi:hypothetical protein
MEKKIVGRLFGIQPVRNNICILYKYEVAQSFVQFIALWVHTLKKTIKLDSSTSIFIDIVDVKLDNEKKRLVEEICVNVCHLVYGYKVSKLATCSIDFFTIQNEYCLLP